MPETNITVSIKPQNKPKKLLLKKKISTSSVNSIDSQSQLRRVGFGSATFI